jgi:hypothetical protein
MIPLAPEQIAYFRRLGMTTPMSPIEIDEHGRAAWRALHSEPLGTPEWFARWQKLIPTGCGCRQGANNLLTLCPPRYDSPDAWFDWTVEYHNLVNAKLNKPAMPLGQARALWRGEPWIQPAIDHVVAITSLSPLPHHREVQQQCLQSWRDFGLRRVVSGNTADEIDSLKDQYDVEFAVVQPSVAFSRPTPRVFDLLQLGSGPMLLLNSDIEILGPQSRLLELVDDRQTAIGIRHNWDDTEDPVAASARMQTNAVAASAQDADEPSAAWRQRLPANSRRIDATLERWGYDVFLLYPEDLTTLPNLDFGIGQPMWDWWLPVHLDLAGVSLEYLADPFFYHRKHSLHWDNSAMAIGRSILADAYGMPADHPSWERWRFARPHSDRASFGV